MSGLFITVLRRAWRWARSAPAALPSAALRVTDEGGQLLANVRVASRSDYMLSVELPASTVVVDLYPHYIRFVERGGRSAYRTCDFACHTYVKFGECLQDRRELHVLIEPALTVAR